MDLEVKLAELKGKVLEKIKDAASTRNVSLISSLTSLANHIEDDERTLTAIEERTQTYERSLSNGALSELSTPLHPAHPPKDIRSRRAIQSNGRQTGREARDTFLKVCREHGYNFTPSGETLYKTSTGKKVVLPFANERRPDRWFLGVQDDQYEVVVLLCRQNSGETINFVLPRAFFEPFWGYLSRRGGQVKFNVTRSGVNWSLLIPGQGPESLSSFIRNYAPLKA